MSSQALQGAFLDEHDAISAIEEVRPARIQSPLQKILRRGLGRGLLFLVAFGRRLVCPFPMHRTRSEQDEGLGQAHKGARLSRRLGLQDEGIIPPGQLHVDLRRVGRRRGVAQCRCKTGRGARKPCPR